MPWPAGAMLCQAGTTALLTSTGLRSGTTRFVFTAPCTTTGYSCHAGPFVISVIDSSTLRLSSDGKVCSCLCALLEPALITHVPHEMLVSGLPWNGKLPGARSGLHLAGICSKPRCDSTVSNGAVQLALPLYSFDVEYAHYRQGSTQLRVPAEIAVVDADLQVVMASYCAPGEHAGALQCYLPLPRMPDAEACSECRLSAGSHCGGVPPEALRNAPARAQVQHELQHLVAGTGRSSYLMLDPEPCSTPDGGWLTGSVLLGHGLAADLAAVGLSHPLADCQDTRDLACFQSSGGAARSLRKLARLHLGCCIQEGPHSARWPHSFAGCNVLHPGSCSPLLSSSVMAGRMLKPSCSSFLIWATCLLDASHELCWHMSFIECLKG